ncbi:MAG TPA: zinc-dependent metalloprotease [Phycisphaerales bacterium]|nr:zinc-dependent metalloprotease [Phycisphaerales bacterium]
MLSDSKRRLILGAATVALLAWAGPTAWGRQADANEPPPGRMGRPDGGKPDGAGDAEKKDKPDFPEFKEVGKDFEKVVSTADGQGSLYTIYKRDKDQQMLAEFPRDFEKQKIFIAGTIAAGTPWATYQGQGGDLYCYWKRFDKRVALIEPNVGTRSTGDAESKFSVARHFTDRVVLDVPIVCMGPGGGPVIDFDALLLDHADKLFPGARNLNKPLASIASIKAFPQNIEATMRVPTASGTLQEFHYSFSVIRDNPDFKPREADERVGYFTTYYRDLGKLDRYDKWIRYINRWDLQKRDPKLALSPPKQPVVYYIENTVPVRYRRWVAAGVLYWNKAFEKVGIVDAIRVEYQDKESGQNMDKDPEDVRYNFITWLSNDISTAIGPSRAHPLTGEILDADIVLTDGWIRAFWSMANEMIPEAAMESFGPETMAWLDRNPNWDPRVRLAPPSRRAEVIERRAREVASGRGLARYGVMPVAAYDPAFPSDAQPDLISDSIAGRKPSSLCMAAVGKAFDMADIGLSMAVMGMVDDEKAPHRGKKGGLKKEDGDKKEDADGGDDDKGGEAKAKDPKEQRLDGIPEWFIGPMLSDLVCHEVGHTLGLRHNFKASSIYTLAQINSPEIKGHKPLGGSVMDYNGLPNINMDPNATQGDFGMIDIGPYDMWAIEYGYTSGDPKKAAARSTEPELAYGTDEDTDGPDPLARRRDLGADPLEYAKSKCELAKYLRGRIIEKYVKDGESWARSRRGYGITLRQQTDALSMMSNWIGGSFVTRAKKGDENAKLPTTPVPAEKQRAALKFVIDNAFSEESFGLTPDLIAHMTVDKWSDPGGQADAGEDETWPIHDRVMGVQASVMTMLLNPTTLRRVYDAEALIPADQDALTVAELLNTIGTAVWTELDKSASGSTARKPMITSLRRNLQREYLDRIIDLSKPDALLGAAAQKPVANLCIARLRELDKKIGTVIDSGGSKLDPYTASHLADAKLRISKFLDAQYIYNTNDIRPSTPGGFIFLGNDPGTSQHSQNGDTARSDR